MSGSHAEAGHGQEAGHESESVIEKFTSGIGNIIDSVRLLVKKVFKGITGFFGDLFGGKSHDEHAAHGETHAAPTAGHAPAAAASAAAATAASH